MESALTSSSAGGESPRTSRVWRMVMIVVAFQLVLIAGGMVVFTALGFANDPTGGCGGG